MPRRPRPALARVALGAVLLAASAAALGAIGATAHQEIVGVRTVLDAVEPAVPDGVVIQVRVSAADQLVVENPTPTEMVVLGDGEEPFLRIGPEGVLANLESPTWYRSNDATGEATVPPALTPEGPPRWGRVSREPAWGWFDHRLHSTPVTRAPGAGEPSRLESWTVPMLYGDQALTVRGHREYRRPEGSFQAAVTSAPERLTAVVLPGQVPALTLRAERGQTVTVIGTHGEEMARLRPGAAEVNDASPTWAVTSGAHGGDVSGVDATAEPSWRAVGQAPEITWLEPRAAYHDEVPPADVLRRDAPTVVLEWEVPVRVGEGAPRDDAIRGETRWVPTAAAGAADSGTRGGGPGTAWMATGAGVAVALAVAWTMVSRGRARRRSPA